MFPMTLDDVKSLYKYRGYVFLRTGVTDEWIVDLLGNHLGEPRWNSETEKYFTVRFDPGAAETGAKPLSHLKEEFDLHTDGAANTEVPRAFVLQCLVDDIEGFGDSVIVNIEDIVRTLDEETIDRLLRAVCTYRYETQYGERQESRGHLLQRGDYGEYHVRYRRDRDADRVRFTMSLADEFAPALVQFEKALESVPLTEFAMTAGDVLLVDNRRMLHGRRTLSGKVAREMRRLWIR